MRPKGTNGLPARETLPTGEERALLVREMFDRVAGRYELLNTVMTVGMNRIWNRNAVKAADLRRISGGTAGLWISPAAPEA